MGIFKNIFSGSSKTKEIELIEKWEIHLNKWMIGRFEENKKG